MFVFPCDCPEMDGITVKEKREINESTRRFCAVTAVGKFRAKASSLREVSFFRRRGNEENFSAEIVSVLSPPD
jgi:hypothetical protein